MPAKKRRFAPSVIQQLFDTPYRFQFFQAVRMVELWFKRHGMPRNRALADFLRFANRTSLAFPASEIEAIRAWPRVRDATEPALRSALQCGELKYVCLTPTFMGFLGSNGALPAHYSERFAIHHAGTRDEGPQVFMDLFLQRPLMQFYQAWRKHRLALQHEIDGKDRFLPLLLALSGVGPGALHGRESAAGHGVMDESIGHFAGALRQRPASIAYVQKVLQDYFSVPLTITHFVGSWYPVPRAHQTELGTANALLGQTAMVGERVWQRDLRVGLRIGPLAQAQFVQFLPGAMAANALQKLVGLFTGVCLEWEVHLVLRAADVPGVRLAGDGAGSRLGWETFLRTLPETSDRHDVRYVFYPSPH